MMDFLQIILALIVLGVYWKGRILLITLSKLPRDAKLAIRFAKHKIMIARAKKADQTVGKLFESFTKKWPNKTCLYFEDRKWTFSQVSDITNRVANYFYEKGLRKGDAVALFMENSAEHVLLSLGLSKIGVEVSLINSNLKQKPLRHCLEVVTCKSVVYGPNLLLPLTEVISVGALKNIPLYYWGLGSQSEMDQCISAAENGIDLSTALDTVSNKSPPSSEAPDFNSVLFYIFTSGTTGLPKAVIFKQSRFITLSLGVSILNGLSTSDIALAVTPLYHSGAQLAGVGHLFCRGIPLVLRRKFSASNFWKECAQYNVTCFHYIGEICRYLLCTPPSPYDRSHKVRIMYGNGMRAEIWDQFVQRFQVPQIAEYYGSTEGNANVLNTDNKVGAVGFLPRYALPFLPMKLVRVDESTGTPIRNPDTGLCTRCKVGEPGEMLGKISLSPDRAFDGYTDKSSTDSKILKDVFKKGDAYFRSGDLLMMDEAGYFYFKDRKGDTFRWKGENVSTYEVEAIIQSITGLNDVVVYGVQVPGSEGRAGMAAVADPDARVDMQKLAQGINAQLPNYARPIFIRIMKDLDKTGTFKILKNDLQNDGFSLKNGQVFMLRDDAYVPLTEELHRQVVQGRARL